MHCEVLKLRKKERKKPTHQTKCLIIKREKRKMMMTKLSKLTNQNFTLLLSA